jgi:urea transport system permease protein
MRAGFIQSANSCVITRLKRWLLVMCIALTPVSGFAEGPAAPIEFSDQVHALINADLSSKEQIVAALATSGNASALPILQALSEGRLYYVIETEHMLITQERDEKLFGTDAFSAQSLGEISRDNVKKISLNNKLRTQLKSEIAKLSLLSPEVDIRLSAIHQLIENNDAESVALLRERQALEQDVEVLHIINSGIAIADINSSDRATRIRAILQLKDSLLPQAKQALEVITARDDSGKYVEQDDELRKHAQRSLASIQAKLRTNYLAETLFFGLSLGSVLLLAAIGLAITFGVMGVINMAHGELIMIGAYTTYMIQTLLPGFIDYSLLLAVPAAFVVSGLFGIAIERGIIRHLYGRPLETLLATFGVSLILQQLVRTTISAQNVIVSTPSWMSGSMQINPVFSITYNRLYILVFSLVVFVALLYVLKKSVLGLQVRAVSQNRSMARAMGVRSARVDALTFGLGSGIAGVAGVALSQLTNVGPNLGQSYIIDSFMVVVFGGVGNLWGTFVGAMSLGVFNKFLEPVSGAVLAKILVLIFIILFIQKKPRGLFPQKGRSAEN